MLVWPRRIDKNACLTAEVSACLSTRIKIASLSMVVKVPVCQTKDACAYLSKFILIINFRLSSLLIVFPL